MAERDGKIQVENKYDNPPKTIKAYIPPITERKEEKMESVDEYTRNFVGEDAKVLASLHQAILDLNGAQSDIIAGQPKSYISPDNYVRYVTATERDGKILSAAQIDIIEQTLNYKALGRGKMGVLGAQMRKELWQYFDKKRECTEVIIAGTSLPNEIKSDLKEYAENLARYNTTAAIIRKNAKSFAAQAGINIYSKVHHWDMRNQKEWISLIAAIGLTEELTGDDLRPIVYLALHPLPLFVSSGFRQAAAGQPVEFELTDPIKTRGKRTIGKEGFVNSVMIRSHAIPAGQATFSVCYAAWQVLSSESYAMNLKKYIKEVSNVDFNEFAELAVDIKKNGEKYHPLAAEFGATFIPVDTEKYKLYLVIAAAYIFEVAKGTLARSAALQKFKDSNNRTVNLWQVRFKLEKSSEKDSVAAFLTSYDKKLPTPSARIAAIEADSKVSEAILDYAKNHAKLYEKVKEVAGRANIIDFVPPSEKNNFQVILGDV